jgi:hypothetical protein
MLPAWSFVDRMNNRRIVGLVVSTLLWCAYSGQLVLAAQTKADPSQNPIQVQLSQKHDSGPLWLQIIDKAAWPLVAAVAIFIFRRPVSQLLDAFGNRGTDLTIGSVAIRIPALESKVAVQQDQINLQTDQIRNLIKFSMSWYIYDMLFQIRKAQREGGEYVYRNDGSMDRNLRFLIEHGYVEEVYPWPSDGEGLTRRVKITQSGEDLIAMRGH